LLFSVGVRGVASDLFDYTKLALVVDLRGEKRYYMAAEGQQDHHDGLINWVLQAHRALQVGMATLRRMHSEGAIKGASAFNMVIGEFLTQFPIEKGTVVNGTKI